jgi:ubiquinone/menaquinone biosynthesis C-methylase UbiE
LTNLILKIRQKLFSIIYPIIDNISANQNESLRHYISNNASGNILEIGAGNGSNLIFYNKYDNLVLIDNNFDLIKQIDKSPSYNLILADMKYLPFKKKSFDSIVSSLVLCSTGNVNTTFNEIDMVLKSKGKYYFWEHTVFSNKLIIALKSFFIYIWQFFTNGCDYNIDNISNLESIKWGHIKIHKKYSRLIKFLGIYYIYGVITKK